MASLAPSADEASDVLQKLTLDSEAKNLDLTELPKEVQSCERPMTPLLPNPMDPILCYYPYGYPPYYHGSYNGAGNEWNDHSTYITANGVDMASGMYGYNGSVMYQPSYGSYGAYPLAASPDSTVGNDDKIYGPLQYHYPPYFKPLTAKSSPFTPNKAASQQWDHSVSTDADQKPMPAENAKGNSNGNANVGNTKKTNGSTPYRPKHQTYRRGAFHGGLRSPNLWLDASVLPNEQCRSTDMTCSFSKAGKWNQDYYTMHQGLASGVASTGGFTNGMYQKKLHGYYGDGFKYGMPFSCYGYSIGTNGYGRSAMDGKYKPREQGVGYYHHHCENIDCLNELSKGPRTKVFKNHNGVAPVTLTVKRQNMPSNDSYSDEKVTLVPDGELYNRADFPENYTDAKFFIIKSYSEDDVHKSIKYNVWSSTSSGNKKLDAAYKEAQQKDGGCHVFLFFSVNASGQFVGLAEMVGPVDFDKNVEHWQQDKWAGCFSVKWHIVKDVPNSLLKHLILENNENKPVTNSRDTQEVKLEQGLKMIKIFKDHSTETSILDDFGFYEDREQIIQQKKAKQQLIKQKIWKGQLGDQDKELADDLQKSLETLPDLIKEPALTAKSIEKDQQSENALAVEAGDGDESKAG